MTIFWVLLAVAAAVLFLYGEFYSARAAGVWPAMGERLDWRDQSLNVRRTGLAEGPPVLLIHGSSANNREFLSNLEPALEDRVQLIIPDRPGAGHSSRPRDAHLLETQAAAMAHVLEETQAPPAVIVGHSYGAAVALRLALDHPERIAGVVLLAPVSHPWDGKPRLHNRLAANPVYGPAFSRLLPLVGPAMSSGGMAGIFGPQDPPDGYEASAGLGLLFRPAAFRSNALDMVAINDELAAQSIRYQEIAAPTVIFSGAKDEVLYPPLHAGGLSKTLPNVDLVKLPETGHMPHHYHAEEIAEAVRALSFGDKSPPAAGRADAAR